jgi:CheY-like chemotaxis protein/Tfp pilus assembly protein PilZ
MPFRLEFADKYRLWSELLHSSTDRAFLPTDERPQLGSRIPVELSLSGTKVRMVLAGTVVGVRVPGGRFPAGVFIRFPPEEIEKCRRFLGLSLPGGYEKARKSPRVRCDLPLQFVSRATGAVYQVRNLSDSGLLCTAPSAVQPGERLQLLLTLDDGGVVPVEAEVSWTRPHDGLAGLRFVDPPAESRRLIVESVRRLQEKGVDGGRKPRPGIVVAEDDPDILTFLTASLSRHGYEVHSAQRGDEALALIREILPEMVLLDILMPGIDGVDLCKMMRADVEMAEIAIIFISALDQDRLHTMADEAGATDYLCKPVNLADLLNLVGRYLRK